jgi:hypothetical protein
MRTGKPLLIAAFLSTAACLTAAAQTQTLTANLVLNPSMEEPLEMRTQLPKSWYRYGKPDQAWKAEIVDEGRYSAKGLRLESTGDYSGATSNRIPVEPGKRYAGRVWVKVDPNTQGTAGVKLDYFDAAGKYLGEVRSSMPKGADGWRLASVIAAGDQFPNTATIGLAMNVSGKGIAWFDDPELVVREAAPNLLADGGMEAVVGETQTKWGLAQAPGGTCRRIRRQVPVKDGWFSLQLVGKADWVSSDHSSYIALDPSKKYTLTGWIRARTGKARIKINYLKDGKYLGQQTSPDVTVNQWTQQTIVADLSRYPEATQLGVGCNSGGEVDAIFDHFVLKAE